MSESERVQEALERGMLRSRMEDWQGASEAFRHAALLDNDSVESRFRLGWALWKYAETIKPTNADLSVGYIAHLIGLEDIAKPRARKFTTHKKLLQESSHWLREAIARDANHARAYFYLAQALKELGYKAEAADIARRAADIEPSNTRYATLVQTYTHEGRPVQFERVKNNDEKRLSWDDLVLDPKTKRELRQMQLMLEKPDMARELGVEPPTGILLKGAPGTGKTTIARILASEAHCKFFSITPADINEMYVGESEKRVKELFTKAREHAPSIIFIDEIDALLPARQGGIAIHSDKVVNQFLQEMDGMTPNQRVFIVGASNRPDMLDPAVRRGGRLSREITIPLPNRDSRRELLALFTKNVRLEEDIDLDALADQTVGYSGADLKAVVNEAGLQALIRIADSTASTKPGKSLTLLDFTEALTNIEPGSSV